MPNQTTGLFKRRPDIEKWCIEQRKTFRLMAPDIAKLATARFGLPVTESVVRNSLTRTGQWELEPQVIEGIPDELIVPEGGFAVPVRKEKPKHPEGWEPHVEIEGDEAKLVSQPMENGTANERELIEGWQLNPDEWAIVGNIGVRRWQTFDGRYLHYYKAQLKRRTSPDHIDVEQLCKEIMKHKPTKKAAPSGDVAFAACIADNQMGKDDGDGTTGIIHRFVRAIEAVDERIANLRKTGTNIGALYVFGLGDLIENVGEFYPQQTFRVQLNLRDQLKVTRRLLVKALQRWAPLAERVVVAAVAGNHGEVRAGGKSITDFADSHDVAVFEQLQEILAANPAAYGHVSFVLPNDRLDVTLDVAGTITGLTHGHQAGKGPTPAVKLMNWWKDQAHERESARITFRTERQR